MTAQSHTAGLHRGYANNLRVEWERRGVGGHSSITLLNSKKRPVAVLLGNYVPAEVDADMDATANLFRAAPDLLKSLRDAIEIHEFREGSATTPWLRRARAAIAKATGEAGQ